MKKLKTFLLGLASAFLSFCVTLSALPFVFLAFCLIAIGVLLPIEDTLDYSDLSTWQPATAFYISEDEDGFKVGDHFVISDNLDNSEPDTLRYLANMQQEYVDLYYDVVFTGSFEEAYTDGGTVIIKCGSYHIFTLNCPMPAHTQSENIPAEYKLNRFKKIECF